MSTTADAESFDVVSAGIDADGAEARELARAISRTDLLDRFVERMRKSMPGATAAAQQPAAPAAG
jgi:ribosomal protein L12E/L44/L45/RPP1/RPP2